MRNLTVKQEKFCQEYVKLGNATEAYKNSYNAKNMKTESITPKASRMLKQANISARVAQLREETAKENKIDREYILKEYMDLLKSCKDEGIDGYGTIKDRTNWTKVLAQITKLLGLDEPDKQEIEHKGLTINIIKPKENK